ncbi:MAG TPA: TIGR01777 family oxidoreductase [Rhabdochlamydiaceae bacterium]|nr:TIGR01777 family oxidoreductase [Rhabdochlamydiaceae bacterium]
MPTNHRILVTGASGFIGRAVVGHFKKQGYVVGRLVRDVRQKAPDTVYWNPMNEEINLDDFEGFHTVIHLAGENVSDGRWSDKKKEAIFISRVRHTWLLAHALSRLKRPPKVFFSASAVGYYGDRGEEILTESSRKGKGFLSDVCAKWEEASQVLDQVKTRVIRARFGAVLSPHGGMIKRLLPLFRSGLAGRLGSGRQWMSWIALEDLIAAIEFTVNQDAQEVREVRRVFNFTSPNPVTNAVFTRQLAKLMHHRPFLPVPAWLIKWVYGEMGKQLLLSSTRAVPKRLLDEGFQFSKAKIEELIL